MTTTDLTSLSREELTRRLREAEGKMQELQDQIPRVAMASAQSSGVDLGPVVQALESMNLSIPESRVNFTVKLSVQMAATSSSADNTLDAEFIERSLETYTSHMEDALRLDSDFEDVSIEDVEIEDVTDVETSIAAY